MMFEEADIIKRRDGPAKSIAPFTLDK